MLLQSVLDVEKQISQSVTFMRTLSVCKNNSTKAFTKSSYTVVDNITVCALLTQYQYFYFHFYSQHVFIMIDITYHVACVHCVWLKKKRNWHNQPTESFWYESVGGWFGVWSHAPHVAFIRKIRGYASSTCPDKYDYIHTAPHPQAQTLYLGQGVMIMIQWS